jgi:hypothetical protein
MPDSHWRCHVNAINGLVKKNYSCEMLIKRLLNNGLFYNSLKQQMYLIYINLQQEILDGYTHDHLQLDFLLPK